MSVGVHSAPGGGPDRAWVKVGREPGPQLLHSELMYGTTGSAGMGKGHFNFDVGDAERVRRFMDWDRNVLRRMDADRAICRISLSTDVSVTDDTVVGCSCNVPHTKQITASNYVTNAMFF